MDKNNLNWYKEGIRFQCLACGECCSDHGEYTYIYLVKTDIHAISAFMHITKKDFLNQFCIMDDGLIYLKMTGSACPFLVEKKCSLYPVRPLQCRTWPFWEENLIPGTWEKEVLPFCPGIGSGVLYSSGEIEQIARDLEKEFEETFNSL